MSCELFLKTTILTEGYTYVFLGDLRQLYDLPGYDTAKVASKNASNLAKAA
jgi:hypothetical protein